MENMIFRAGEMDIFFKTPRKKVWKCLLMQEIPCPNGLETSFRTVFGLFTCGHFDHIGHV